MDKDELDFLRATEQQAVLHAMDEIRGANSTLYIGKHLAALQEILSPYGYFLRALSELRIVHRTGYGYIQAYRNATLQLPPGAVQALMGSTLKLNANRGRAFGEWTEVINSFPPPESGSPDVYAKWVEELIKRKPKRLTGHKANRIRKSPDVLMEECTHVIQRAWMRLPRQQAVRERFAQALIEKTLECFGLKERSIEPEMSESPRARKRT